MLILYSIRVRSSFSEGWKRVVKRSVVSFHVIRDGWETRIRVCPGNGG